VGIDGVLLYLVEGAYMRICDVVAHHGINQNIYCCQPSNAGRRRGVCFKWLECSFPWISFLPCELLELSLDFVLEVVEGGRTGAWYCQPSASTEGVQTYDPGHSLAHGRGSC
jgi:hypothetical protein